VGESAASLKQMRIVHTIFVVAVLLQAYVTEQTVGKGARTGLPANFIGAIVLVASFEVLLAYFFWRKRLLPSAEKLRLDPLDRRALQQWRGSTLLILVLSMSVGLHGIVLRFMGASRQVSWPFFVSALILMVVWRPQLELGADVSGTQANQ
jgi:hypothetical protein